MWGHLAVHGLLRVNAGYFRNSPLPFPTNEVSYLATANRMRGRGGSYPPAR